MRIKLDENLPFRAAQCLRNLGHDAETVLEEGLGGQTDSRIWEAAQQEGRFLITQDLDFSDMRRFAPGTHPGILLVRLDDREQPQIADFLDAWFSTEPIETWNGAFVVATSRKIRVLRAPVVPIESVP